MKETWRQGDRMQKGSIRRKNSGRTMEKRMEEKLIEGQWTHESKMKKRITERKG